MRLTLPARVALGMVAQMAVFCGALLYVAISADRLSEDLAAVKEGLEPAVEDLRTLVGEIKTHEDLLATGRAADLERVTRWLPRTRIPARIATHANTLRRVAGARVARGKAATELVRAADALAECVDGKRLLTGPDRPGWIDGAARPPATHAALYDEALSRMTAAVGRASEHEASGMARDLLRVLRHMRAGILKAQVAATAARRDTDHELMRRRSDASMALVAVTAGGMVAALLLLLVSIRALRPVGDLALAVRRLAAGDYSEVAMRSSRELADLSEALNSLAATLRARETEQERRSEEMMRTERLAVVGRMASVVAHEVRNPLNSIALNVDLLREMLEGPGRDPARALDVLRAVQGEVDRLAEITEEYLRFGRMPKGVMAACDLGRVLRETRDFMEGEFAAAGIAVRTELPDVPLRVRTDEGQFRQALINILRNAVEAMPDGGTLTLRAAEQDDRVVVAVADTGVGIPDAFKARLFEPFATTKPRGTGLGLAFVQQVVQESGGDVSIDSAPGRGTTISMVLRRAG
jgi:signal transduction histidine kinase